MLIGLCMCVAVFMLGASQFDCGRVNIGQPIDYVVNGSQYMATVKLTRAQHKHCNTHIHKPINTLHPPRGHKRPPAHARPQGRPCGTR